MKDNVNHPPHYLAHPSGIECIEVTEHMSFCVGNAVKYLWRADHKGKDIEDLRKAAWYINREIERREKEWFVTIPKQTEKPKQPEQLELFELPIRSTEPFGW
jgi:hypothetical protein